MKQIELVFRTVGERTSERALELAIQHLAPSRVHVLDQVRPFSETVRRMLTLDYRGDFIIFLDADCLVMEDMRPFLERNEEPYVDCYVLDRFRGRLHAGVHITRRDVLEAMQRVQVRESELKYVLRPESYIRHLAMEEMGLSKAAAPFRIYHDFGQSYADIFAKYALRELRSRTPEQRAKLDRVMLGWDASEPDLMVARHAVQRTRELVPLDEPSHVLAEYIAALPTLAAEEMAKLGIPEKAPLGTEEIVGWEQRHGHLFGGKGQKVFGVGLSRTGTKSLTSALDILGYTVAHHPADEITFQELVTGTYQLSILNRGGFDGLTDLIPAAFYPQLDRAYPHSKFILTTRDKESWLEAMERHWMEKPILEDIPGKETKMKMRRFLRAATYGTYTFSRERLAYVYDMHHENVRRYFRDRPDDLLIFNVCDGEGWQPLCPFLGLPLLQDTFPHIRSKSALTEMVGSTHLATPVASQAESFSANGHELDPSALSSL